MMKTYTEEQIIKGCLSNKRDCQKALYDKYYGKMMPVCMRYSENNQEAQDYLQNGFIKVFGNIKKYEGKGSLEGWVRKVIVNSIIDDIRKNKNIYTLYNQDEVVDVEDEKEESFYESMSKEITPEKIIEEMGTLSNAYRTVFNLYLFEGFTHKEISDMLGISVGASRSNYSKAKKQMKNKLLKSMEAKV